MKMFYYMIFLIVCFSFATCFAEGYVTEQELLEASGLRESDISGVDLKYLINTFEITGEMLKSAKQEEIRELILERVEEYKDNVAYLFMEDAKQWNWRNDRIDGIYRLAMIISEKGYINSVLADFGTNKVYYGDILYNLEDTICLSVSGSGFFDILSEAEIGNWTLGKSDEVTSYGYYTIAVEYEGGTIERLNLWDLDDNGRARMRDFRKAIFSLFEEF